MIQNKMDFLSALRFLKLKEIPDGKFVYFVYDVDHVFWKKKLWNEVWYF